MSPISVATPSNHARSPHLPDAQGPPRSFSLRLSFFGRKRRSEEGNLASGLAGGDPGAVDEAAAPDVPIPGIARGGPCVNGERSMPKAPVPGFAGGDPGVKKEQFSFAASNSGSAGGDLCGEGPQIPDPAKSKEENPFTILHNDQIQKIRTLPCEHTSSCS